MKKIIFSQSLLQKYLDNQCNLKEKAIVEGWFNEELNKGGYTLNEEQLDETEKAIWQNLEQQHEKAKHIPVKRFKTWYALSAAAACILILLLFKVLLLKDNQAHPPADLHAYVATVKENNLIQLSDGSVVILDKGSKLSYPKSFKGKKLREVYLTGKAFFDIKHDPAQPFIVHAGNVKTTVLGTAFDITARPGSEVVTVSVIRGKVNVSAKGGSLGDLLPNRKVTYNVKTDQSKFATVNSQQDMQWTSQNMMLNDITFEAICKQLEKRYNVNIQISDDGLKSEKFTISLKTGENLDNFLATICDFNKAVYRFDKESNQYIITSAKGN